ncbi:MAG: alpha/beta hydrolase [Hylemonella sp.]|uniref:alpha/beta fold hydrolase n=1 Tax=Hylemonella sp. TaxID=2066020 RepID=UPI0022CCCCA8|nr:alpha/beta hydrolase [Hylemonella sp.]MCZ8253828.1 alpha/beta hydrolase [Hylemonella sp.]
MLTALAALSALSLWLWTPDLPRAPLEQRYLAAESDMIEVGVWRLHVRDSGTPPAHPRAPPVLMLHGFGSSLHTWDAWAEELAPRHRVIRVDLPGSGLSPPDPTDNYSDTRTLELLITLLDQLGVERISVIGHSMGGRIAWTLAARYPARMHKLVLVAPDGFASPPFDYGQAVDVPAVLALMRYVLPRSVLKMNLKAAYAKPEALSEERLSRYHDLIRAPGARDAMLARLRQTVLVPPQPLLRQIQAPTLLLWGELDGVIPITNAGDYLQAIPHSRLARLADVGHVPQEEAAQSTLLLLQEFLQQE